MFSLPFQRALALVVPEGVNTERKYKLMMKCMYQRRMYFQRNIVRRFVAF